MELLEHVIRNDDKTLTIKLNHGDFDIKAEQYLLSDNGKILLKHQTVSMLADAIGINVGKPTLIISHNPAVYVFSRTVSLGDTEITEIGESNSANMFDEVMKVNPATIADNRAYERAVLKLIGIYGEVYGSSEMDFKDDKKKSAVSKKEPKKQNDTLKDDVDKANKEADESKASVPDGTPFWWNDTGMGAFRESQLDPEVAIVTQGPCSGKNWTVKQLYDYQYKSCVFFAERTNLENASDDFKIQVYACRRVIRKYGLK